MKKIQLLYPSKSQEDDIYRFTLKKANVSIVNALRRVILTDIPTVVFKTFPYKENQATFHINTSRLNNEILKQRLACIPIHIQDISTPLDNLLVEISKKNTTNAIQYVTTGDFKIKNTKTDKYLSESERNRIFPRNQKTKDYILFARLRPTLSDQILGEELRITAKMSIGKAKSSGTYNVVSTCSYRMTPDKEKQRDAWDIEASNLEKKKYTTKQIQDEKINWYNHTAKRYYEQDTFDFTIETVGVYSNSDILSMACDIMISDLDMNTFKINKSSSTIENSYDIILDHQDYTIGKVLEYILNKEYYQKKKLIYVGFRKNHPHDTYSIIRIAFKNSIEKPAIIQFLKDVCQRGVSMYENIKSQIK